MLEPSERYGDAVATSAPSRRVAWWIPAGMLDWPGRVTSTLFLSGCSFRCAFCHNPDLIAPAEKPVDWQLFLGHVRAKRAWLDGVVVTGGEPTDDPDLPALLAALAEEGLPVKLDTNGSRPRVLRHLLAEGLVEHVAMDVKTVPEKYADVTGSKCSEDVLESVGVILDSGVDHEFRTTVYPQAVDLDDLPRIASRVRGGKLYAIQQFRPDVTLDRRASDETPYDAAHLRRVAEECSRYLPTVVRGA